MSSRRTYQTYSPSFGGFPNDIRATLVYASSVEFNPVTFGVDLTTFLRINNPTQTVFNVNPSCPNSWNELGAIYNQAVVTSTKVEMKAMISKANAPVGQVQQPTPYTAHLTLRGMTNNNATGTTIGETERPDSVTQFLSTENPNMQPVFTSYYKNWELQGYNNATDYEDDPENQIPVQNLPFAMPLGHETRLGIFVKNVTRPAVLPGPPQENNDIDFVMHLKVTFYLKFLSRKTITASQFVEVLNPPLP